MENDRKPTEQEIQDAMQEREAVRAHYLSRGANSEDLDFNPLYQQYLSIQKQAGIELRLEHPGYNGPFKEFDFMFQGSVSQNAKDQENEVRKNALRQLYSERKRRERLTNKLQNGPFAEFASATPQDDDLDKEYLQENLYDMVHEECPLQEGIQYYIKNRNQQ